MTKKKKPVPKKKHVETTEEVVEVKKIKTEKLSGGDLARRIIAWIMLVAMVASIFTIAISVLAK